MFKIDTYIPALIELLKAAYKERLLYVGLQGSYLRGEATEHSDIDIMVVISDLSVADLAKYREVISSLEDHDKSCGFICGEEELRNWNPLEICHLLHTTKDHYGVLAELVPQYSENDVRNFVKLSLGNLYHEICHRYLHAPKEKNVSKLPFTYRSVFFILQNLYYLDSGKFVGTKKELREELSGKDRLVLDTAISLGGGCEFDFDEAFELLFAWCREKLSGGCSCETIDSRCGLHCTGCEYKTPFNCGGCIETNGHPFHGECPVAACCQSKGKVHCGQCGEFPCGLLVQYSCDPEHGDTPPGARIEQCRRWRDLSK